MIDDVAKIGFDTRRVCCQPGEQWDSNGLPAWRGRPDCPVTGAAGVDLFASPYLDDPYPFFARWRATEPVFYDPAIDHWVVAGHEDVRRVLRDADAFSALNVQDPVTPWPPDVVESFAAHGFGLRPNLSNNDPPSHTHVRGFLRDAFNPRRVRWLESHVVRLATASVDRFEPRLRRGEEVDLVDTMFRDVPAEVLFVFLGIPDADIERVKRWSAGRALLTWGRLPDDDVRRQLPDFVDYLRFCFDLVERLRVEPGDDYTSELLRRIDTEQPDDFDAGRVAQTLFGLLMAGHETTTNQAALAVRALLAEPDAWTRVQPRPGAHPGRGRGADPLRLQRGRLAPPGAHRRRAVGGHRARRGAAAGAPRIGQPRRGAVRRRRPARARPAQRPRARRLRVRCPLLPRRSARPPRVAGVPRGAHPSPPDARTGARPPTVTRRTRRTVVRRPCPSGWRGPADRSGDARQEGCSE